MTSRDILEARLVLYRLLAVLYRYPLTAEKLSALQNLQAESESSAAQAVFALQRSVGSGNLSVDHLNVEMTRLMEGPGITPAVPMPRTT